MVWCTKPLSMHNCDKYELMERIFRAKLEQHPDVEQILRDSGSRELLKRYALDYDWGGWF